MSGGHPVLLNVSPSQRGRLRLEMQSLARNEKRKVSSAANTGETSKIIGGLGAAVATAGTIALATATLPATLPALAITGFGYLVAVGGIWVRHRVMELSYWHQEQQDAYTDVVAELR